MKFNNVDFDTYFKNYPDAEGYFGNYGGSYIPPELQTAMNEISEAYQTICKSRKFISELRRIRKEFQGRPTPISHLARLSDKIGTGVQLYVKREDLNHTGAHKLNHCMGEVLLAKYMGKKKVIAETGAGQHGVALATAAAYFGLDCDIYMGAVDVKKQAPNVARMKILGARVIEVTDGLQTLKEAGVTKISIGIQSFSDKYQKILGRKTVDTAAMAAALAAVPFETVSMDFIFALPGQTFEDLRADIDAAFSLGANHVAIYPFIDFTFTDSSVAAMPKREKRELLDAITRYCMSRGYPRSSIWTFSNEPNASYSSMTRDNFLGFGCSATSLFKEQFKINTFDVDSYCERIRSGRLATALTLRFTRRQRMVYWLFWTAYSTRVNADDFEAFFGVPLKKMYGMELWLAKRLGFVTEHGSTCEMTLKGAFFYHYYENFYTLSYIDKMWGILREKAFPESIEL